MTKITLNLPIDLNDWLTQQADQRNTSTEEHVIFLLEAVKETATTNRERLALIELDEPEVWDVGDGIKL